MRKKWIPVFIIALFLCGCGKKETTESIVEKMFAQEINSASVRMVMDAQFVLSASNISEDFTFLDNLQADMQRTESGTDAHFISEFAASAMGDTLNLQNEAYLSAFGKNIAYYTLKNGEWEQKNIDKTGLSEESVRNSLKSILLGATLLKDKEEIGGDSCYVLYLETDLSHLYDAFGAGTGIKEYADLLIQKGFSENKIKTYLAFLKVQIYVYATEEGVCKRVILDFSGSDLSGLLQYMKLNPEPLQAEQDFAARYPIDNITIMNLRFTFEITDHNTVMVAIPEEILSQNR